MAAVVESIFDKENIFNEEEDIRGLVFLDNKRQGVCGVFQSFEMDMEFSVLSDRAGGRNFWYKEQNYLVCGTSLWLSHTVAKVFEANNLMPVAYVVLSDVNEDTMPESLYCFILDKQQGCRYVRISLAADKDYVFHLEDKKYNLAADGTVTEAKKEDMSKEEESPGERRKNKGKLERVSHFFKNKYSGSSSSSSSTMGRRPGER